MYRPNDEIYGNYYTETIRKMYGSSTQQPHDPTAPSHSTLAHNTRPPDAQPLHQARLTYPTLHDCTAFTLAHKTPRCAASTSITHKVIYPYRVGHSKSLSKLPLHGLVDVDILLRRPRKHAREDSMNGPLAHFREACHKAE